MTLTTGLIFFVCSFMVGGMLGNEERYFLSTKYAKSTVDSEYTCGLARCDEIRPFLTALLILLTTVETIRLAVRYRLQLATGSSNITLWTLDNFFFTPLRECCEFAIQITSIARFYSIWKHLRYIYRFARLSITRPLFIPYRILYALGHGGMALCVFLAAVAAGIRRDHNYRIYRHDPEWFSRQVQAIACCL